MNNDRRKLLDALVDRLETTLGNIRTAKDELESIKDDLSSVKGEEQDAFDNMPESFQQGDRGEAATNAISEMEEAEGHIEDAISNIDNAKV